MTKVFISPGGGTKIYPIEFWHGTVYETLPSTDVVKDVERIAARLREINCVEVAIEDNCCNWEMLAALLRPKLPPTMLITRNTVYKGHDECNVQVTQKPLTKEQQDARQ